MKRLTDFSLLKAQQEFSDIYKARKWHTDNLVCHFKAGKNRKVAFVASKKIGGAVQRNRAKRRLRAMFVTHANNLKEGVYLFVAKAAITTSSHQQLSDDFLIALTKLSSIHSSTLHQH